MVKSEDNKIQSDPSKSIPTTSSCKKRKFKGVRMRSWGSWVSEIRAPNQKTRIWLGSYSTPEAAARAYDAALLCLKGSSANLNFPITSTPFIPDTIMSPKSIQRVAAAAANNNYNNATTPTSPTPPSTPITNPTTPSTPSSILPSTPSQSTSSSSSNHNDNDHHDHVSLIPYWPNYTTTYISEEPIRPLVDPWIDFDGLQSPKYVDQMLNACSMYAPPTTIEDFYYDESADIRLWSFC